MSFGSLSEKKKIFFAVPNRLQDSGLQKLLLIAFKIFPFNSFNLALTDPFNA